MGLIEPLKLSVCITCYNQVEYIEKAIESVRTQNLNYPYEILVGDDGSSDGSYELLVEKYGALENVRIFRQERENSVHEYPTFRHAKLLVRLMREVRGTYFSIMDGDDYYCDADCFQRKTDILDKPENSDCILVMSNFKYVYGDGSEKVANPNPLPDKRDFISSVFGDKDETADSYCHLATAVIRSRVIAYLDEKYTQDLDDTAVIWWAMNYGKRYYDHNVAYAYVKREGSVFSSMKRETFVLRTLLSADVLNLQWGNRYRKYTRRKWAKAFLELYAFRNELPSILDYDIWYPCACQYKGWGYELMHYIEAPPFEKRKLEVKAAYFKIKVYFPQIMAYSKAVVLFLLDTKIPFSEKIQKVKNRKGMQDL